MIRQKLLAFFKNWRTIEQSGYWVVWGILAFLPVIFWDISEPEQKIKLIGGWIRILPFFIIFLVHNLLLLPQLLLKRHYALYAVASLLLILLVNYWFLYSDFLHEQTRELFDSIRETAYGDQEGHGRQSEHFRRGRSGRFNDKRFGKPEFWRMRDSQYILYTYNVFISLLLVGFNAAMKFTAQWLSREQDRKEIEKVAAESQLLALQNQVSPHFFMNTLNNIHALIEYSKEEAQEAVLRLSKMMRYLLYESDHGKTPLTKEIEFLRSYIELMKLRLQPDVELKITLPDPKPDVQVDSFLFIHFVENAFKHGIDPQANSFIHILLEENDGGLHFKCKNSKALNKAPIEEGGIGIVNAKKRMELLFGDNFQLNIYDRETEFEVDLIVPVS